MEEPAGDRFCPTEVEADAPAGPGGCEPRPDLIHPGTAWEFRAPLEEVLAWLPAGLARGVAEQGYLLHVLDSQGVHPLTLELDELDPRAAGLEELCPDHPVRLLELARERGAARDHEVQELVEWMAQANPDLELLHPAAHSMVRAGQVLRVPACYFWQGRRISPEAWELLTRARRTNVAGLVVHGPLPGFRGNDPRILLWDKVFRRGDGLTDWYVLHELGHTTDFTFAFRRPDPWRAWKARLEAALARATQEGRLLTRYSGESPTEYFAEGFSAWATPTGHRREPGPDYQPEPLAQQRYLADRSALERLDPELAELIGVAVAASSQ